MYILAWERKYDDFGAWFNLFLTGIGLIPTVGSAFKGVVKTLKTSDNVNLAAITKLLGPFANKLDSLRNFSTYTNQAAGHAKRVIGDLTNKVAETANTLREYIRFDPTGKLRPFINKLDEFNNSLKSIRASIDDKFRQIGEEIQQQLDKLFKNSPLNDKLGTNKPTKVGKEGSERGVRETSDNAAKKAAELPKAIAQAKTIAETHDAIDTPVTILITTLSTTFKPQYSWIKRFEARPKTKPGHYSIHMIASDHKIDDDYTERKDKIAHGGWYSRKELRKKIHEAQYSDHGKKHLKAKTEEEAKEFSKKAAQYLPGTNNAELEKIALFQGTHIPRGHKEAFWRIHRFDDYVGYDGGIKTRWIRAEYSSGTYHGHPMRIERVRKYIKNAKE